jgi:hypothetical protein
MEFKTLKKNRGEEIKKLTEKINAMNSKSFEPDARYWRLTTDKSKNGFAIIRFLPAPGSEDSPFVRLWSHAFQGPKSGLWYIENSLTTLGQKDPMSEYNTMLYNSGIESDKKFVSEKSKRKLHYISNILIVQDKANPENEGKVFLFKYGKKIFEQLNDLMNPLEGEDAQPINPFDLWEGANFNLRQRMVEDYPNYDKSSFASASPVASSDAEMEKIWKSEYSLEDEVNESKFKTYDELKDRLTLVMQLNEKPLIKSAEERIQTRKPSTKSSEETPPWETDDEDLAFFNKLKGDLED